MAHIRSLIFDCRGHALYVNGWSINFNDQKLVLMHKHLLTAVLYLAIPATAGAQSITRGKYLVERTSLCNDCHTPRDEKGQLITAQSLQGAPTGSQPIQPSPGPIPRPQ
jgi:hypothetical protein